MITRICKTCLSKFKMPACYMKRPGNPGTYCSRKCTYPFRPCSVGGCSNKHKSKGYCGKHYMRIRLHGTINIPFEGQSRPGKVNGMYGSRRTGSKNPCWRGGVSHANHLFRTSKEYSSWRKAVFERDNYTCQWCGKRGGMMHADHIKPFWSYVKLRLDLNNGRTLCVSCHKKTPTFGRKALAVG